MPYPWLMRLSLSAAIALPPAMTLWLAIPASASSVHANDPISAANALSADAAADTPTIAKTPKLTPEPSETTARFSGSHPSATRPADHVHQSGQRALQPRLTANVTGAADAAGDPPTAASEIANETNATTSAPPVAQVASTVLPQIATPQFNVLFSQIDTDSPAPEIDVEATESTPLEAIEGTDDTAIPDAVIEDEAPASPALDAIETDDTVIPDEPDAVLEEAPPDGVETIEEEEEVFSPLPESEVDIETNDLEEGTPDEAGLEEDGVNLEDLGQPEPDAPPNDPPGEPVFIPAERVLDELQFLDPDPNPLLLQTFPEEVEIVGTQPLTLEEAIELAYRNNPDLRVALLELEQRRAALRETQAELYPRVSVNGNFQGQNTTDSSTGVVQTPGGGLSFETESTEELGFSYSAGVDVVYNLYSSGRRGAAIRAAEEQLQLSELELERRREELRLATASEYYDLQAAIEAIRISQAFLEEAERNLRDTVLREEVGVGTRFDVLRAEVQVANARQDLVNSQRARQVAQRTLARRLNVPPALTITTVPVDIAGTWPLDLEESIVLAFQNRAELEQQLTQREINEELRTASLAALGPQVDLFANYNIRDTLTQDNSFADNYNFGARVSWTLYEGGAAQAQARQRELDIEIAERNFEEARNTIRLSVESAYFNLQSNLTNIDTARLAVEQAQEALELAILRFDAGVGTQLDILNAQSELTDAEVNLVQAIVGYNRSLAELERAVSNLPEPYYEDIPY